MLLSLVLLWHHPFSLSRAMSMCWLPFLPLRLSAPPSLFLFVYLHPSLFTSPLVLVPSVPLWTGLKSASRGVCGWNPQVFVLKTSFIFFKRPAGGRLLHVCTLFISNRWKQTGCRHNRLTLQKMHQPGIASTCSEEDLCQIHCYSNTQTQKRSSRVWCSKKQPK